MKLEQPAAPFTRIDPGAVAGDSTAPTDAPAAATREQIATRRSGQAR